MLMRYKVKFLLRTRIHDLAVTSRFVELNTTHLILPVLA